MPGEHSFLHGQPAIATDIYLPKKFTSRPNFRQLLEDSLKVKAVRDHFDNSPQSRIERYLPGKLKRRFEPPSSYDAFKEDFKAASRVFGGYTIFDVDGAFAASNGTTQVIYDANSCVRIIDLIDLKKVRGEDEVPSEFVLFVSRVLATLRLHHVYEQSAHDNDARTLTQAFAERLFERSPKTQAIHQAFDRWIDHGSFLLYGFLMCQIVEMARTEQEIWLTSQYAIVNRYRS